MWEAFGSTFSPTERPRAASAASSVAWVTRFSRKSFMTRRDPIEWSAERLASMGTRPPR